MDFIFIFHMVFISFALFLVRYFRVWFLYKNLKNTFKSSKT